MTKEGGKQLGRGTTVRGKGAGSGGLTDLQDQKIGQNAVLSNRDKSEHSRERGQDSKWVETEQRQDHAANKGRG